MNHISNAPELHMASDRLYRTVQIQTFQSPQKGVLGSADLQSQGCLSAQSALRALPVPDN